MISRRSILQSLSCLPFLTFLKKVKANSPIPKDKPFGYKQQAEGRAMRSSTGERLQVIEFDEKGHPTKECVEAIFKEKEWELITQIANPKIYTRKSLAYLEEKDAIGNMFGTSFYGEVSITQYYFSYSSYSSLSIVDTKNSIKTNHRASSYEIDPNVYGKPTLR